MEVIRGGALRSAAGWFALGSLTLASPTAWPADMTVPNTFVAGKPANAAEINQNFSATATSVNSKQDRVTGTCPAGQAIRSILADGSVVCEATLGSRLTAMEASLNYMPVGPQTNVIQTRVALGGWSICYTEPYSGTGVVATILAACNKANLMLACRATGTDSYSLLAQAPRADVTFVTAADTTSVHTANGTAWYFNTTQSWGFAKAGDPVNKNSCDFMGTANNPLRLCWHAGGGSLSSGYRCGATEGIFGTNFQRVVLHRD